MRKLFTFLMMAVAVVAMQAQVTEPTVTELWNFSKVKGNQQEDYDKNGLAVSNDGTHLYRGQRTANAVGVFNASDGTFVKHLAQLSGFTPSYGGDVAVDGNGAIYASNVTIGANGVLKVAKWANESATPTTFISSTIADGNNRVGYGFDVFVDSNGDGFLLMHQNSGANLFYWEIANNAVLSQDPTKVTIATTPAYADLYTRISIVDKDHFWIDGSMTLPAYATITRSGSTYSAPTSVSAARLATRSDINTGVGGAVEFMLKGSRYAVFAANNHAAGKDPHHALLQKMGVGNAVDGAVIAKLPDSDGLGNTTDASHFVEPVVHVDEANNTAYIYIMGGLNGTAAFKLEVPAPEPEPEVTKTFTVTVPAGTQNVYIVGSFPDKNWDATDPYQLAPTANPNEFTGTFPFHPAGALADAFEYKYLNGKVDWDYGEAKIDGGNMVIYEGKPVGADNRSYNASDVVANWVASPSATLNVSFGEGVNTPANLFVKGDWDAWAAGKAMTKSGDKFSVTINQKTFANTEYKYYSDDPSNGNWETRVDNRWAIYPAMNDEIAGFVTEIPDAGEPEPEVGVLQLVFKKTDYAWNTGDNSRSAAYYDGYIYPIDKGGKKLHVLSVVDGSEGTAIADDNFTGFGATADQAGNKYVTSSAWGMTGNLQGTLMLAGESPVYANTSSATGGRIDFVSAYGNLKTNGYLAGATTNTADNIAVWSVTNGVINAASPIIISGKRVGTQNSGAENSGAEIVWMDANKVMATTADRSIAIVTLDYGTPENSTTQEIGGEFKLHAPVGGGAYFRTKTKEYIAVPKNQYGAIAVYNITNLGAPIQIGETTANVGSNDNGALHVSVHASLAKVDDDVIATIYVWAPNNGLAVYKVNLGADLLVGVDNNTAKADYRIKRTATGIAVDLVETASIEVYTMNGVMIDRAVANGSYSRDLANGIYIIRINGQAVKFVK